jgi:hypothetical protein
MYLFHKLAAKDEKYCQVMTWHGKDGITFAITHRFLPGRNDALMYLCPARE